MKNVQDVQKKKTMVFEITTRLRFFITPSIDCGAPSSTGATMEYLRGLAGPVPGTRRTARHRKRGAGPPRPQHRHAQSLPSLPPGFFFFLLACRGGGASEGRTAPLPRSRPGGAPKGRAQQLGPLPSDAFCAVLSKCAV